MSQQYLCLHDIPIFKGLPRETFVCVCDASQKRHLDKGEYLFHQGDDADAIYIVKSGIIKLTRIMESGEEIIVKLVHQRHAIGENTLFSDVPKHEVSAIALEEVELCGLDRSSFENAIIENPELAKDVIRSLGNTLTKLHMEVAESTAFSSTDRVLGVLRDLADQNGIETEVGILINVNITQSELSSMVGLSRVMTSQILKKLESDGTIKKDKRKYILMTS